MSEAGSFTRRRFLEVSTFVGGGLLVGCQLGKSSTAGGSAIQAEAATLLCTMSQEKSEGLRHWGGGGRDFAGLMGVLRDRNLGT